jgi:DNA repair protein RecO
MFITTSGIVLRVYPFRDKKYIAKIFTEKSGLISCIITKNKAQIPLSQILTIAEITYKMNKTHSLFYIRDVQIEYVYKSLTVNTQKIRISMVLCEILNKCINEPNILIYDFLVSAFKYLDQMSTEIVGFETLFIIKFCEILGISPFSNTAADMNNAMLDIEAGQFIHSSEHLNNKSLIPKRESVLLYKLSKLDFYELESCYITNTLNLRLLNYMILYMSTHLSDLTNLKSMKIIPDLV